MTRALKLVCDALLQLELDASDDHALKREARAIREAFTARREAILALRRSARESRPKPPEMWIEMFLPAVPEADVTAFVERINIALPNGAERLNWWSKVYRGEA